DNVFFLGAGRAGIAAALPILAGLRIGLLLVHRLAELHGSLGQRSGLGLEHAHILALERFLQVGERVLDRTPLGFADFGAVFGQRLVSGVDERIGVVLRLDQFFALL